MAQLQVEKHPDKTFIGRIARGFNFLGYWFSPSGLSIAQKTVERMLDKVSRLYEQGALEEQRIEAYLKRWWQWVRSGVDGFLSAIAHRPSEDKFYHQLIEHQSARYFPS